MAHEPTVMIAVFEYGCLVGVLFQNPADSIKRRKVIRKPITVPSREQFRTLIETIRQSDGRKDSQLKAAARADLVELLAFSGCRIHEAASLTWVDVDFEKNTLTITGGDRGTKSPEPRTIPMTTALGDLLRRLLADRNLEPTDRISLHQTARRCLTTACKHLNYPLFTHHDFRHFFATSCIESGVDISTPSRWMGHRDGGALAMRA